MKEENYLRFRTYYWPGIVFSVLLFCSCAEKLDESRAIELIRLNYKQQSTTDGAGVWLLDTVVVDKMIRIKSDSVPTYQVTAQISGLYKLPNIEDAPAGYTERFFDTLQFVARKYNKVWMADDWTIIGSRHE